MPTAQAAFPGNNGKIAFASNADGDEEIYTINPDGTGLTQLTHNTETDWKPNWSADGSKILFNRGATLPSVWVMNADGSGQAFVTSDPQLGTKEPGWSPDATRITYVQTGTECDFPGPGVVVADADGSNEQVLTCPNDGDGRPRWSPDGQKIAFDSTGYTGEAWIYTINPDGTGLTRLTDDPSISYAPDWSPDGSKIAFADLLSDGIATVPRNGGSKTLLTTGTGHYWPSWSPDGSKIVVNRGSSLYIINSDGTTATFLTQGNSPDWQPIPFTGYPRPQAATPMRISLALAHNPCTAPNRTHGPPLDSPSCSPPAPASDHLTVGTFDANGEAAKAVGSVRLTALSELPIDPNNGDQGDVRIDFKVTDVRASDLTDYTGELGVSATRRITDRNNTPAPGTATVQDDTFAFSVPCTPTGATNVGSTCTLNTTADTLVPGTVTERQRSVWQLDQVEVRDGGPDGDADTPAGNTLFMTQGIFVP